MKIARFVSLRSLLLKLLPVAAGCLALAGTTKAGDVSQEVYPLYSFTGLNDGANPYAGLIQGSDGYLYGTAYEGGTNGEGAVFQISADGAFTPLYSFDYSDGAYPYAGLVQASDGYFYGTTSEGGSNYYGTVFKISTDGAFTQLHAFDYSDGEDPFAGLIQASDGNLYGTTVGGGTNYDGTVFRISTNGAFTPLYSFDDTNGASPYGGLIQGSDGNLYGTTYGGGANRYYGTVFKISTNGAFTLLHSFDYSDGGYPNASLIQASDGNLYGTTYGGGSNYDGTVFKISTNGAFTPLYSFDFSDGEYPYAGLIQGSDGYLYGTTYDGGTGGEGTIFQISTNGEFSLLYSFTGTNDGAYPEGGLIQAANGNLYGTTYYGGASNSGTIFVVDALQVAPPNLLFTFRAGGPIPAATQTITLNGLAPISWGLANPSTALSFSATSGALTPGVATSLTVSLTAAAASLSPELYSATILITNLSDGVVQGVQIDLQVLLSSLAALPGSDGEYPYAGLVQASDGYFYGTTSGGGTYGYGTVFRISTNSALSILYSFTGGNDGIPTYANLIQASDGNLYGTTSGGGAYGYGTVFRISTNGALTTLYSFTGLNDGGYSYGGLIQAGDGNLYGTASVGGANGYGTVFRITPKGGFSAFYSFTGANDQAYPYAGLVQASDGYLYGTAYGEAFYGAVFKISTGGAFTSLYSFSGENDGAYPEAPLIQASDGYLYGTAAAGGLNGQGTAFRISTNGFFDPLFSFNDTDGSTPLTALCQAADGYLYGTTATGTDRSSSGTLFRLSTNGVFNSLHLFSGPDGADPQAGLIQASDGGLYGTTVGGGFSSQGTVFKITTSGALTLLHSFVVTSQLEPVGGLQISGSNFYGTTYYGGTNGQGSVFEFTTNGAVTTFYSFSSGTGDEPEAGLIQASDGNLYGTTYRGGTDGDGTVFRLSTNGVFTPLFSFDLTDGAYPDAALVQAGDGYLYGTTYNGGANGDGTIFRISTNGAFTLLHSFDYSDGAYPAAALIQASDGYLYGTTYGGGSNYDGTIFRISTSGAFTLLYSFDYSDGASPEAALVQAGDGKLYGTTYDGGTYGDGTVFRITINGVFTLLYSFTGVEDGSYPTAGLTLAGNGELYGTTPSGGVSDFGTVFQITTNGAFTSIYSFGGAGDGGNPVGGLVEFSDGYLYGITEEGGANDSGAVFRILVPAATASPGPVTIEVLPFTGSDLALTFPTVLGQSYTVWQNTSLATAGWLVYTNFTGSGGLFKLVIPATNAPGAFFYVTEP